MKLPVSTRISNVKLREIDIAAALSGENRSEFIANRAFEAATKKITETKRSDPQALNKATDKIDGEDQK